GLAQTLPPYEALHLLLLDCDGRLLDRLSFGIHWWGHSPEEGGEGPGELFTDRDGAEVVVRCDADRDSPDCTCEVDHGGRVRYSYVSWHERVVPKRHTLIWGNAVVEDELCRVAIRDGKFAVLFPSLEQPAGRR